MKKLIIYYNFILITIMTLGGFIGAATPPELLSAVLFYPLMVYFMIQVAPRKQKALVIPQVAPSPKPKRKKKKKAEAKVEELSKVNEESQNSFDLDRRAFVKLIGSAGLSLFMLSLFTKRAHGAFFGSVPGPGTVALKDTTGTQIDPARHHPTAGYRVVQLDDSTPAFYGFQNKDGAWFIMKEDSSGNFRYAYGASDFTNATTGWPNRTNLTYDYFENVF